MIKVSVVLTVFNGQDYLDRCMESIFHQTLKDIEIICVDDASTDETWQILNSYNTDIPIRIIRNEQNCGAGASRNIGMKYATGEYLSFLDADDIFEYTMLEKAYAKAKRYQADMCIFKEDIFGEDENIRRGYAYAHGLMKELEQKGAFTPKEIKTKIFNIWNGWAWDKIFRREFVEKTGLLFQEIRTSNDGFFVHASLASAKKLVFINEVLVHHRTNVVGSLSATRNKSWQCCYEYLAKLRAYLVENNLYEMYEQSFMNWIGHFFYWNYQTLSEENRRSMYSAFKTHILNEFEVEKYKRDIYYDKFKYLFLSQLTTSETYEECMIPITELSRFSSIYSENKDKVEKVLGFFKNDITGIGIWGAGERGKAFLKVYGKNIAIDFVFDNNPFKEGEVIQDGYVIQKLKEFDYGKICILVMNSAYVLDIVKQVRNTSSETIVFDLDSYICQDVSLESCIM